MSRPAVQSVHGFRPDLGIHCDSKMESNWARYLEFQRRHGLITAWKREPCIFWFNKPRGTGKGVSCGILKYTPDFCVTNPDGSLTYYEVKGYMDSRSKTKIKRMKTYYPEVKLEVIDKKRYNKVASQMGGLIKEWE